MKISRKTAQELGAFLAVQLHNQGNIIDRRSAILDLKIDLYEQIDEGNPGSATRRAFTEEFNAKLDQLEPLNSPRSRW